MPMFALTGKTILITGASGGIGDAIAEKCHAQGANLILSGRKQDALARLQDRLQPTLAPDQTIVIHPVDLAQPESIAAMMKEHAKSIDVLVNNAGITKDNLLMRMKDNEWDEVIAVDLTATMLMTRGLLPSLLKKRNGRIISITSVVGAVGSAGQTNYAAAKAGVVGFSKSLAAEVAARGITVNCVAPGFIATPMTDVLTDTQKTGIMASIPAGRMGTPDDVASCVVFLASEEASYVTGQTLHVNGGMARFA